MKVYIEGASPLSPQDCLAKLIELDEQRRAINVTAQEHESAAQECHRQAQEIRTVRAKYAAAFAKSLDLPVAAPPEPVSVPERAR